MSAKFTNEEYLRKLSENNINIKPLEDVNGTHGKIKHLCFCGREWYTQPRHVLNGSTCGCDKNLRKNITTEDYVKTLNERNIKVTPLQSYQKSRIKILHRCECGNEWSVSPNEVLRGNKCGCGKRKMLFEKYKGRKTVLYYVKIENYYKIGVALFNKSEEKSVRVRYKNEKLKVKILKTKTFNDGSEAYMKEQEILELFDDYRLKTNEMKHFGGYTELFVKDISKVFPL